MIGASAAAQVTAPRLRPATAAAVRGLLGLVHEISLHARQA
jgi:hypothetical protein